MHDKNAVFFFVDINRIFGVFKSLAGLSFQLSLFLYGSAVLSQGVGINSGGQGPDASAILDVASSSKGLLPPRMTTAQRDAIVNPAEGLLIFNTTTKCIEYFAYQNWQSFNCAVCPFPSAATTGIHVAGVNQVTWNWNAVAGATGYKWHTVNNIAAATDIGNVTTLTQSGLSCNTAYTLYVWAYNACGNAPVTTLSQNTLACPFSCGSSVTFTYKGQSVTYGTIQRAYGGTVGTKCWLDRNLGATQVAASSTDVNAYGDLFQWGRRDDGHQVRNSATTATLSSTITPSHSQFILAPNSPSDWLITPNSTLWQGVNGQNNPCPVGWRIPTIEELEAERLSWSVQNNTGAFNSPLRLPCGGWRFYNGSIMDPATSGNYWSSSTDGIYARVLVFLSSSLSPPNGASYLNGYFRSYGSSVRCIKD